MISPERQIRATHSDSVAHTLAAGDVFHWAFALATAENQVVEVALRFASAAAAIARPTFDVAYAEATARAPSIDAPLVLWGSSEERTGGRLRLNSLCGINLAAFALRRLGHDYRWLYRDPSDADAPAELLQAATGTRRALSAPDDDMTGHEMKPDPAAQARAIEVRRHLSGSTGVVAQATPLTRLFDRANEAQHD